MAYGKKSFTREFDQRDRSMMAANATTAAQALTAACVEAGLITSTEDAGKAFWDMRAKVLTANLQVAGAEEDSIGEAESVVRSIAPNTTEVKESSTEDDGPGSVKLKFSSHKDKTIAQVYEEDPSFVTEFLAKKTNNEFIKRKANEFVESLSA